jgi:guanosine-3',5'-bis(diphosphate) 3'-pyrophosphohydrolase
VQANRPSEDVSLIRKAWEFCVKHHEGQMRASGEPYIIHPLEVAEVLAEMKLDATAIAAGLLHDCRRGHAGDQARRLPSLATRWRTSSRA